MPHKSSVPLFWRLKKSRYSLVGSRCATCGSLFFPPKTLCPACRRKGKLEDYSFSGKGEIVSYTVIRVPPEGFESPYTIAIIRLDEGPTVSGQVVDEPEKVGIGKRVRAVFRKISEDGTSGLIHYGTKWEIDKQPEQ